MMGDIFFGWGATWYEDGGGGLFSCLPQSFGDLLRIWFETESRSHEVIQTPTCSLPLAERSSARSRQDNTSGAVCSGVHYIPWHPYKA